MGIIDRIKNILFTPKTEWPKIAEEAATTQSLYIGYICIVSAIGPVALILRTGGLATITAVATYAIGLAVTFVIALIIDALAPTFGAEKNFIQSLKLAAYSYTAAWVAGIFHLIPVAGAILIFIAAIYSWYTFYLGLPVMKKCPPEKAVGYTIVVVLCGIVLGVLLGGVLMSMIVGGSMMGAMGGFR